jgi:hypothetical protein
MRAVKQGWVKAAGLTWKTLKALSYSTYAQAKGHLNKVRKSSMAQRIPYIGDEEDTNTDPSVPTVRYISKRGIIKHHTLFMDETGKDKGKGIDAPDLLVLSYDGFIMIRCSASDTGAQLAAAYADAHQFLQEYGSEIKLNVLGTSTRHQHKAPAQLLA